MQKSTLLCEDAWQQVAVTIGFLRANVKHELRYSILALLPTLRLMANDLFRPDVAKGESGERTEGELSCAAATAAVKESGLNADRFIGTRFAQAEIARFIALPAAPNAARLHEPPRL